MGKIMERVLEFFDTDTWGYDVDLASGVVESGVHTDNGTFAFRVFVDEEAEVLALVIPVTGWTPEERRSTVCEFLVRTNWSLSFGCLHMDLHDGEVVHRSVLDLEDGELSVGMVRNLVLAGCRAVEFVYPGLMAVTYAGLSPAEATGQAGFGEAPVTAMVQ